LVIPPADGENGWYIKPVTVTAQGTDATSGVLSQLVSLDGTTWSPSESLSEDGIYSVQARVIDQAGNTSTVSQVVQIDHTPPVLSSPTLAGTIGQAGWYTSSVGVSASATDATSGIASLLYSVDGGDPSAGSRQAWQSGSPTLPDGRHTIQIQATDQAGNASSETQAVNIDSTPPQSTFTSPADGSLAFAHGHAFSMSGHSSDAGSGLDAAQISLDAGASWQPLTVDPDGSWAFTWDTTKASNGRHVIQMRATDLAGNIEDSARITVVIANLGPSVSITSSWYLYQTANVQIAGGVLPISGARIVVSDGGAHTRSYTYSPAALPSSFQWDGVWDDGSKASPGKYQVALSAWDMLGNDAHAVGTVQVPYPIHTPTPTSTATPVPTRTDSPTQAPTEIQPAPTATLQVALANTVAPLAPPSPPSSPPAKQPVLLWPAIGLVGFLAALSASAMVDKRPSAIHRLGNALTHAASRPENTNS
jgi:hypothetical protein